MCSREKMREVSSDVYKRQLGKNAKIVFAEQIENGQDGEILLMTDKGYAKRTPVSEFEEQGRNGKGLKAYLLNDATGKTIIGALLLSQISKVTVIQKSGDMHKLMTDTIPQDARNTKGEQVVLAIMGNDAARLYRNIFE